MHEKHDVRILMYHALHGESFPHESIEGRDNFYAVAESDFEKQLSFLESLADCRILKFCDAALGFSEKETRDCVGNVISITFDDSYESNYNIAFPSLKRHKMPATFFITVGEVGEQNRVSWDQLDEMSRAGMEIGSHSLTHADLIDLSSERLKSELIDSKKILEDHLGLEVLTLGIPHGRYNLRVVDMAREAGYRAIATSDYGVNSMFEQSFLWRRIHLRSTTGMEVFRAYASGDRRVIRRERFRVGLHKAARNVLGFRLYNGIRSLLLRGK